MITGVGNSAEDSFSAILNGKTGVDTITYFDTKNDQVRIASEVKNFDPSSLLNSKELKRVDRFIPLGLHATTEAIKDAKLDIGTLNTNRIGVSAASGIGGLTMLEKNIEKNLLGKRMSPFTIPGVITSMLAGYISIHHQLKGPNLSSTTACAAGLHAITQAVKTIMTGGADIMLAVGSEASITEIGVRGFNAMGALSKQNDIPPIASRPFDLNRDGFVIGEGAAALVIETLESAKERGAHIYATISGFGESADAINITAPSIDGPIRAIKAALSMANNPKIDYINAHGTSTILGDINETNVLKNVFSSVPPVSSTKGATGHCLGATGIIEAVISIMSLNQNIMPPTINLLTPDPQCNLDYIPNIARVKELSNVLSVNYAFGGSNGAIIFTKFNAKSYEEIKLNQL